MLTPFFLAGIGLHLDLRALAASETLLLTALIAVVAVISKVVGCGGGAMRLGRAYALHVGAGTAPRRGVGMVVAQIGLRMNVLSGGVYYAVVLVAIVTTLLGPVMLDAAFRGVSRHRTRPPGKFSIG